MKLFVVPSGQLLVVRISLCAGHVQFDVSVLVSVLTGVPFGPLGQLME